MGPPSYTPTIPKYLGEGLQKQDVETLKAIEAYIHELLEWLNEAPDDIEFDDDEEEVDVEYSRGFTRVIKRVPCGKQCNGCPHGPYEYHVRRKGNKLEWQYIGRVR